MSTIDTGSSIMDYSFIRIIINTVDNHVNEAHVKRQERITDVTAGQTEGSWKAESW